MKALSIIGGIALGILVIAAIALGGWWVGWWFKEQNVGKEAHIFRASYANQERLREDASEKFSEALDEEVVAGELPPSEAAQIYRLEASAHAITGIACHDVGQLTELTPELEQLAAERCN